jgi:enoyl-CoA hydratase/carnithine racemase
MSAAVLDRPADATPERSGQGAAAWRPSPVLTVQETDEVVTAYLARPEKCNAISLQVIAALTDVVHGLLASHDPRPFVLRGTGSWFASGGDLREFAAFTPEEAAAMARDMASLLRAIERLRGPTVAALNGPAIGGGVELSLAFDIRAAAASSYLRFAQTHMGIVTGWQGVERLARLVGSSTCLYLMLTGARVPADEALRLGLVNVIWPDDAFELELDRLISSVVAAGDPGLAVKQVLRAAVPNGVSAGTLELQLLRELWQHPRRLRAMQSALSRSSASR